MNAEAVAGARPAVGLVAESLPMRKLLRLVERVAPAGVPVLVNGETGAGKEVIARALHDASGRRGPFVAVNCAALPSALAEAELFGHARGSFTGAERDRAGLFQQASGGTLLLDEIGDMDLALQAKLLRALDTGKVRPLGAGREVEVDVRVIAATHRDLLAAVDEGRFREDLYYRLAAVVLIVPSLRERLDDVEPLARRFLAEACAGRPAPALPDETIEWLQVQPWRGNVRELRQATHRAVLLGGDVLLPRDFAVQNGTAALARAAWLRRDCRPEIERAAIVDALQRHGNVRAAARALGMARSTLHDRARALGIVAGSAGARSSASRRRSG